MSRTIQVFEYEALTIHKDWKGRFLLLKELNKLYEFNDKNNNNYFVGIRDGIKFKNYVGVIQIGGVTIEILPKADKNKSSKDDFKNWHNALLNMLKICKHINVISVSEANLKKKQHSLLDLYFEMYLNEIETLLRAGLIKNYRYNDANILALKGRLDFNKNIQKNLIHQERFYTTHQIYDYDHLINQILLRGLVILKTITYNTSLKDRIERILANFPKIKEVQIQKHHFDKIIQNRKTASYFKVLQIAKMIILNYSPDISSGSENMLTLLFDMNKLWEEYIYRMLLRVKDNSLTINFQNIQKFWESKTVRPDLVITKKIDNITETYIIDTKWKVLDALNPKPNDGDLKQMYVYNLYWNAKRSLLLYPNSLKTNEKFGNYWKGRDIPTENQCKLGFIDVLDGNQRLNLDIGVDIIKKFE